MGEGFPSPFHGGRLCAGTTEGGMGPRIREDNEGKGNCRNGGMSGKREEGGRARMRDSSAALGMICGRWGKRTGMDSRRRLHGGRISTRGQRGEGQLYNGGMSGKREEGGRADARFLGSDALRLE